MAENLEFIKRVNAALALRDIPDYEAALNQLKKAAVLEPQTASLQLLLGVTYQDLKNYADAESCFRQALALQPDLLEAQQSLGLVLVHNGKYSEAIPLLKPLADSDPSNVSVIRALSRSYDETDNKKEAIIILQNAIVTHPDDITLLKPLSFILFDIGDYKNAKKVLDHILELKPSDMVYNFRGIIAIMENKLKEAASNFEEAVKIDPEDDNYIKNLAQAYLQLGWQEKALTLVNTGLEKLPTSENLLILKAHIYVITNRFIETLDILDHLDKIPDEKQDELFILNYAALLGAGLYQQSFDLLQNRHQSQNQERINELLDSVENLGVNFFVRGHLAASKTLFDQVITIEPERLRSINNLGFIYLSERNWASAQELFLRAENLGFEEKAILKANLGYIELSNQNFRKANSLFYEALDATDEEEAALLYVAYPWKGKLFEDRADNYPSRHILIRVIVLANLATVNIMIGEENLAIEFAQKAIETDPKESTGYRVLGCVSYILGDVEKAREMWEKALKSKKSKTEDQVIKEWINSL